jgi:hypothetical protein
LRALTAAGALSALGFGRTRPSEWRFGPEAAEARNGCARLSSPGGAKSAAIPRETRKPYSPSSAGAAALQAKCLWVRASATSGEGIA